ncbi:phosphodiester glycosidase family protein [uncultured Desulfovibrio sp.]|uniref:phosphodiester glycosidase family protein n=1 Tax=uncultured Desulfovibrio sp. TaxID=167968 RepID=UPI00261AA428|nr:phosphodiester glycosidase family protein [uncultured Desulfovibrio sp.]
MRTTFEATILFRRLLAGCHGAPLLALLLVCWLLSAAGASAEPAAALTADTPPAAPESLALPPAGQRGVDQKGGATWATLEPGLELGEFRFSDSEASLTALRIDPARFDFLLCASSQDGRPPRSLNDWGEQYDLTVAINASMYLPDGSTSTGYMRQGGHINNKRLVQRFGAFFVAGPDSADLPPAAILDRDNPQWRRIIDRYALVVQNYRMINAQRRILWAPGGPLCSISAVAQDGDGRILFLHCRASVEAYAFAQQLLHLPLDVRTVMYVEGGAQAGLLVRSISLRRELAGSHAPSFLMTGNLTALLPNILGARRKADASAPAGGKATAPAGQPVRNQ